MKYKIIFLCTGNSARSQMAEGLLKHLAGDRFEVFSAGIKPTKLNPLAEKVMAEIGIDISKQKSKSVKGFLYNQFDCVITVCDNARESCPFFSGKYKKIHWNLQDPASVHGTEKEKLLVFREIRNKIRKNITRFLTSYNF